MTWNYERMLFSLKLNLFIYQAIGSSLIPSGFLTVQFLQKTWLWSLCCDGISRWIFSALFASIREKKVKTFPCFILWSLSKLSHSSRNEEKHHPISPPSKQRNQAEYNKQNTIDSIILFSAGRPVFKIIGQEKKKNVAWIGCNVYTIRGFAV